MKKLKTTMAICLAAALLAAPAKADLKSTLAKEAAEAVIAKFGSRAARQGVPALTARIETYAAMYGPDAYQAVRKVGPQAFELSFPQESWRDDLESIAKALSMGGIRLGSRVVWAAMTSLFLSMPPLHADRPDRQGAFIANALRLHLELGTMS